MRSAIFLAEQDDFFPSLRRVLVTDGAMASADGTHVQVDGEGARALLYALPGDEWRQPVPTPSPGCTPPVLATATAVIIECRHPGLVVAVARALGRLLPYDVWLLDGADVIWAAADLERGRITL